MKHRASRGTQKATHIFGRGSAVHLSREGTLSIFDSLHARKIEKVHVCINNTRTVLPAAVSRYEHLRVLVLLVLLYLYGCNIRRLVSRRELRRQSLTLLLLRWIVERLDCAVSVCLLLKFAPFCHFYCSCVAFFALHAFAVPMHSTEQHVRGLLLLQYL